VLTLQILHVVDDGDPSRHFDLTVSVGGPSLEEVEHFGARHVAHRRADRAALDESAALRASNAALANPQMAQTYAQQLMQQMANRTRNPAGGTSNNGMPQQLQDLLNQAPRDMSWFYKPLTGGTDPVNANRIPTASDSYNPDWWNIDFSSGLPFENSDFTGGYGSYEGTPGSLYQGGDWTNDTWNTDSASYYDPYGMGGLDFGDF